MTTSVHLTPGLQAMGDVLLVDITLTWTVAGLAPSAGLSTAEVVGLLEQMRANNILQVVGLAPASSPAPGLPVYKLTAHGVATLVAAYHAAGKPLPGRPTHRFDGEDPSS